MAKSFEEPIKKTDVYLTPYSYFYVQFDACCLFHGWGNGVARGREYCQGLVNIIWKFKLSDKFDKYDKSICMVHIF